MSDNQQAPLLIFADLGRRPYKPVLDLQHRLAHGLRSGSEDAPQWLLAVEHEPVITIGRRGRQSDVLIDEEARRRYGVEVYRVDRGGEVTYHGPGQLVMYAIVRVNPRRFGVSDLVRGTFEVLMEQLSQLGICARYRSDAPGLWVKGAKIGAVGMRVSGGVSSHGVALNVAMDLKGFSWVVPCGMEEVLLTDISRELDINTPCPDLRDLARSIAVRFVTRFGFELSFQASGLPW